MVCLLKTSKVYITAGPLCASRPAAAEAIMASNDPIRRSAIFWFKR